MPPHTTLCLVSAARAQHVTDNRKGTKAGENQDRFVAKNAFVKYVWGSNVRDYHCICLYLYK